MNFLIFVLLIVVCASNLTKELEPDCKKGFSKFFVVFLIFLMFSTFFDFAYSLLVEIMGKLYRNGEITPDVLYNAINITWNVTYWLGLLNKLIAFILLFSSMEINLFNKKSKWKFVILAVILLGGTFLITIVDNILDNTISGIGYVITSLIVAVLTNFNYLTLAIVILILLGKTAKENESLKTYTRPISIGVVFLFIIYPIILLIRNIVYLIYYLVGFPREIYSWVFQGAYYLTSISFIIGIILLTKGALKTMSTPLTFSREKGAKKAKEAKGIQRKSTSQCSECGAPISPGIEFCTNCGNHI